MARGARRGNPDDSSDEEGTGGNANVPSVNIDALVAAMTNAITTAMTAAVSATAPPPSTLRRISTAINPYDTESLDLNSKEGKYHWKMVTEREEGWRALSLTTDSSEPLANLIKDRARQFGLDPIMDVPTEGTGDCLTAPRTVGGRDYCAMDLSKFLNIIHEPHKVKLAHVRQFSLWFMGDESSTMSVPTNTKQMVIKAIDPNKPGNQGLVNQRKILLRQLSGMLDAILKNHLERTSYVSLNTKFALFQYKDEVTGRHYDCGLVKLKLAFGVVNPMLAVDHAIKERELEQLTLLECESNVHTYLTTLQTKRNVINSSLPQGEHYPTRRFNTHMFSQLEKSTCNDFLTDVKAAKSRWITKPDTFDQVTEIGNLITLYTNYASSGTWTKLSPTDTKFLALATQVHNLKSGRRGDDSSRDYKKPKPSPGAPSGKRTPLETWRFTQKGKINHDKGVKYQWCELHGHKNEDGIQSGMYMPAPHNHEDWVEKKNGKLAAWKAKAADRKLGASGGGNTKGDTKPNSLTLAKSFKSILTSNVKMSDSEADYLIDKALKDQDKKKDGGN